MKRIQVTVLGLGTAHKLWRSTSNLPLHNMDNKDLLETKKQRSTTQDEKVHGYFQRVGLPTYDKSTKRTLTTLNNILERHTQIIPFENLDVLLRRPISLEIDDLYRKIIEEKRGGYCFEQNLLLSFVLTTLGYRVSHLGGRIRWNAPSRDVVTPRTHVFLKVHDVVEPGDEWIVDAGSAPSQAIPFTFDIEHTTSHDIRRLVKDAESGRMFIQLKLGPNVWRDSCEFTFEPMHPIDIEIANWFTSASPRSHFLNRLIVGRAGPNGTRVFVNEGVFSIRERDGKIIEEIKITSGEQLLKILATNFGLDFPPGTVFGPPGSPWCS